LLQHLDARFCEQVPGKVVRVTFLIHNGRYTGVDDHFRADDTGVIGAVENGSLGSYSVKSCLDDSILFGVESPAQFMTLSRGNVQLVPKAPPFGTM
jgi:hypothetical protein